MSCDPKKEQDQSSDHRYLEQLEFNPELRKSWLNFFVSNFRTVILLIILLTGWGIYSFFNLPRESNPEVKIPYAIVTAVFPGASPEDVEELVTKKIETAVSSIKGVKKITSSSANSFSAISVEFDTKENQEDVLRKLRDKVAEIKDFPQEVETPEAKEISFSDEPIFSVSLTGIEDGFLLRGYAEKIKDGLEKIPGVREVHISGGLEKEFSIAYDPNKLTFYNLSPIQINQLVATANTAIPSGNFEGESFNYTVRTDARVFSQEELKNLPLTHTQAGAIVYLKDIAQVKEQAIKKTTYSRLSANGSPAKEAVNLDIVKKSGGSIIATTEEAKKTIEELLKTFPKGMSYEVTTDFAKIIDHDFKQLTHDFLITIVLVMGVLFLIVGLKEALVAGLAIPLVFFATFGVMLLTGITLNFLSIFSLLLALGLLVDDAIVVVSATKQYMKSGKFTPEEAVLLVLNDFKIVLLSTTLATTFAFLPLLLSTGIIGSFIRSIPITVSVTLVSSLLIALMINHPLAAVLERIRLTKNLLLFYVLLFLIIVGWGLKVQRIWGLSASLLAFLVLIVIGWWYAKRNGKTRLENNQKLAEEEWRSDELIKEKLKKQAQGEEKDLISRLIHGILCFEKVIPVYEKYLRRTLASKKSRFLVIASTLLIFVVSVLLPVLGVVKTEFFPASDEDMLYINLQAPIGFNLDKTNELTAKVEERLEKYPDIQNFATIVGQAGASPDGGTTVSQGNSHLAGITITLKEKRSLKSYELAQKIRQDLSGVSGLSSVSVESAKSGPPSGASFEARVVGEDLQTLDKISQDLKPILASIPGAINVKTSLKEAPAQYTFKLNHEKLELYNLNAASVGGILRLAVSGIKISTIIKENEEIDIVSRFAKDQIPTLKALQDLKITNLQNQPVFLKDVATIKLDPSVESISRTDQKRAVLLSASAEGKTRSNFILSEFQKKVKEGYQLPEGYTLVYGGENEQNTESVKSIITAMIIAAILIVSTLIIQFDSFIKALIVLVTLPLALIGVFLGMAVFGITLSFPGLIGILALFGIVVKNAIILIDKINLNLKSKIPFKEAIVDAGKSRIEAIFITSLCTILGIIPVTLSNEVWRALGGAIIFGLMLSSFLTLFIVPVLFASFIKNKEQF
jgi:HAE1 family hydrophobic/amphiphilic exporter-1